MTKIDVFSGFLGAGKTTLIKKLITEAYTGERLVLIENEFGDIGIDGGFMQDAGIEVTEMNSGCICCSLVGDFGKALEKVLTEYKPDRILIEPSGVGKLSDVLRAIGRVEGATLNACVTVVDAAKCRMYMKNFGEFFADQVEHAGCVVLSHTTNVSEEKLNQAISLLKEKNTKATIVTTPWEFLTGSSILAAMEQKDTLQIAIDTLSHTHHEHDHHHEHEHHHEHDKNCTCGCHEHDHDHHHEHEHHHEHDKNCTCGCHEHDHDHHHEHEHHHEHDENCTCGCHGHEHDGHHHADEVFESWGIETTHRYTENDIQAILEGFAESTDSGMILRSKGIVPAENGGWIHFDYVPGEPDVRRGSASVTGRICVIGTNLNKDVLAKLFAVGA